MLTKSISHLVTTYICMYLPTFACTFLHLHVPTYICTYLPTCCKFEREQMMTESQVVVNQCLHNTSFSVYKTRLVRVINFTSKPFTRTNAPSCFRMRALCRYARTLSQQLTPLLPHTQTHTLKHIDDFTHLPPSTHVPIPLNILP